MAKWTDGPEYAPLQRPEVFVAPDAAPLPGEPEAPPVGAPEPALPLPVFTPAAQGVALDALEPPAAAARDPHQPFDVVSTPMTAWQPPVPQVPAGQPPVESLPPVVEPVEPLTTGPRPTLGPDGFPRLDGGSAWRGAHASTTPPPPSAPWTPQQPFAPSAWPPSAAPPAPTRGQPRPVGIGEIASAVTPGVLICLAVGAAVSPLALPLYLVAMALASRIEYRRSTIARAFSIGIFVVLALGLGSMLWRQGTFDVFGWYSESMGWAMWANLAMAVYSLATVGQAIRTGEEPEPR
ncbi:hypothetical protein [Propioniciclava sp.]|uniref:hypothetical protein n=1 Tax=Propioniciclava sp. TaxID=2038686 RepID=UPI00260E8FDE|nr:hypothetical protein [Propioniciclava sp.]